MTDELLLIELERSLEINQERFGYSDELKSILKNTVDFIVGAK